MLVDRTSNAPLPTISAILDWDSAVIASAFLSAAPLMWLWDWKYDEDENERLANNVLPTAEGRELKALFEEAAGEDHIRLAYEPAYRLARQLVLFAINDVRSNEAYREGGKAMIQEWAVVRPQGKAKP